MTPNCAYLQLDSALKCLSAPPPASTRGFVPRFMPVGVHCRSNPPPIIVEHLAVVPVIVVGLVDQWISVGFPHASLLPPFFAAQSSCELLLLHRCVSRILVQSRGLSCHQSPLPNVLRLTTPRTARVCLSLGSSLNCREVKSASKTFPTYTMCFLRGSRVFVCMSARGGGRQGINNYFMFYGHGLFTDPWVYLVPRQHRHFVSLFFGKTGFGLKGRKYPVRQGLTRPRERHGLLLSLP